MTELSVWMGSVGYERLFDEISYYKLWTKCNTYEYNCSCKSLGSTIFNLRDNKFIQTLVAYIYIYIYLCNCL